MPEGSWHFIPSVERIAKALEDIHGWSEKERAKNSERGVQFIRDNFSCDVVTDKYWVPFLERVGDEIERGITERRWVEKKAHMEARNVLRDRLRVLRDYTPKLRKESAKPPETAEKQAG